MTPAACGFPLPSEAIPDNIVGRKKCNKNKTAEVSHPMRASLRRGERMTKYPGGNQVKEEKVHALVGNQIYRKTWRKIQIYNYGIERT